ncbi:zinc finger, c4 type (two domains) domain-containing protein [Ditylenchus destructor]|nr:zinc finger, c4 type (two domains) domain-containing protein [Ditylenchus destructor]
MDNPPSSSSNCVVCNSPHHGTHFKVLACRACSSFFRRTIVERKVYKCRNNNDCDIFKDGMRNACRACRLQHCLRAGMRAESHMDKVENQGTAQSIFTGINNLAINQCSVTNSNTLTNNDQIALNVPTATPLLEHYRSGLRNFTSGQRSLFTVENPETMFSDPQYKPLKQADFLRMGRGSVSLLHTMCINYFEPFNNIPYDKKVEILKHYWKCFAFLHGAHLTIAALPYFEKLRQDSTDSSTSGRKHVSDKFVSHYGYYTDMKNMYDYFAENDVMSFEKGDYEKVVGYCEPLMEMTFSFLDQFHELDPSEMEFVAMLAIHFWNSVDKFDLLDAEMKQKRDTVFAELNSIHLRTLGAAKGAPRLGQIMCFLQKLMGQAIEMYESATVVKIFLPQIRDVWDEDICPVPSVPPRTVSNSKPKNGD